MVFALWDYTKYRLRWGIYSHQFLTSHGLNLATSENFPDLDIIKPGFILFYHPTNSFLGWLVMYYTCGYVSHCAVLVEQALVVDCTTSGVIKHPLSDYLDGKGYLAFRVPRGLNDEMGGRISKVARDHIGYRYGWGTAFSLFLTAILGFQRLYRIVWFFDFALVSLAPIVVGIIFWMPVAYAVICLNVGFASIVLLNRIQPIRCIGQRPSA